MNTKSQVYELEVSRNLTFTGILTRTDTEDTLDGPEGGTPITGIDLGRSLFRLINPAGE